MTILYSLDMNTNWSPLLIRLGLAAVFIVHGLAKFLDMENTVGFFGSLGLPAVVAYLIALIETLGGLAMLLGVYTKWAGYLLALVMVGAIALVKGKMGFSGGYEFDLMLLLAALAIALGGPGKFSIMRAKELPKSVISTENSPS